MLLLCLFCVDERLTVDGHRTVDWILDFAMLLFFGLPTLLLPGAVVNQKV